MSETRQTKQVLIVRKDLNMRKGKIAAQCSHASMKVLLDRMVRGTYTVGSPAFVGSLPERKEVRIGGSDLVLSEEETSTSHQTRTLMYETGSPLQMWLDGSFAKICVSVNSEAELDEIYAKALAANLPAALIVDSGRTEFHGQPTKTVVAVGPGYVDEIDVITGGLPLL